MRILLADEDLDSRHLLLAALRRWDYDVVVASDGHDAERILLSSDPPKLAIMDALQSGIEGAQVCMEVRRKNPDLDTYIMLLTDEGAWGDAVESLDVGANDYVKKPFDLRELKVRLRTGQRILYLQEQLASARTALRDQATHDRLTGIWNRAAILDVLSTELARARRQGAPVSVIMADVDSLQRINEAHGHPVGDEVLRKVALTIRDATRRYDAVGRYSGEQFVIVLPGCDVANALGHAERLRLAISSLGIKAPTAIVHPTLSLGVAVADNDHRPDAFDLIQSADNALCRAKNSGRNRVELGTVEGLLVV